MSKNIIFYFSGSGNSFKVAKDIAAEIPDCEIISMGTSKKFPMTTVYEKIGFVFPTYCTGIPLKVGDFVSKLELQSNKDSYFFSVVTCGAKAMNSLPQLNNILKKQNIQLSYGNELQMFANYVGLYPMAKNAKEKTIESSQKLLPIIQGIKNKTKNEIQGENIILKIPYTLMTKTFNNKDKGFNVSDKCTSCGICKSVCPVDNIEMQNKKPTFKHKCEQCMACIQFCPNKSINYKNKTQKRGRYHHPCVTHKDLSKKNSEAK